ncbi:hypothetical protein BASA81_000711 [Batrachochytrium salamandrivorans]|nr:hypothetical protein BASA81_000711 [Batrachochytrium salamandrivorans]
MKAAGTIASGEAGGKMFSRLGLSGPSIQYMSSRFSSPTPVQELAIPVLLKGTSALMSAETGTGKTLGFLLPLVIRMQSFEQQRKVSGNSTVARGKYFTQGPRTVVFSPTRELSGQLFTQAKSLSHELKFKARLWGNEKKKLGLEVVPDLVVSSPGTFLRENKYNPALIESLVIDEVDAMLFHNSGFTDEITGFIKTLNQNCQIVCVGATALKGDSWEWLKSIRKDAVKLKPNGGGNVLLPDTISVHFEQVEDREGYDKHGALERALATFLFKKKSSRCIIFCNSVASCRSTHHVMTEKFAEECDSYCLHGEMRPLQREESWNAFSQSNPSSSSLKKRVLVCTDLSSRGLDVHDVDLVVIFDIPNSLPDLIHRAGRTGRAGRQGQVTFVVGRGEKQKVTQLLLGKN